MSRFCSNGAIWGKEGAKEKQEREEDSSPDSPK